MLSMARFLPLACPSIKADATNGPHQAAICQLLPAYLFPAEPCVRKPQNYGDEWSECAQGKLGVKTVSRIAYPSIAYTSPHMPLQRIVHTAMARLLLPIAMLPRLSRNWA